MRKTVQLLLIAAMFFSLSTFAYSAPGLYVGGNLGLASLNDSDVSAPNYSASVTTDMGASLSGVVGYAFENNFRIEGELVSQANEFDQSKESGSNYSLTGDVTSLAIMANGYYDFNNKSRFTPFIGAGIGFANVSVNDLHYVGYSDDANIDDDDTVFAYQLSAGVGFEITERITLDLKYRYFETEDLDIKNGTVEYSSNNVYTGIRLSF